MSFQSRCLVAQTVGDIPLLLDYLIDRYTKKAGKKIRKIERKTMELFQAYNLVEAALAESRGRVSVQLEQRPNLGFPDKLSNRKESTSTVLSLRSWHPVRLMLQVHLAVSFIKHIGRGGLEPRTVWCRSRKMRGR